MKWCGSEEARHSVPEGVSNVMIVLTVSCCIGRVAVITASNVRWWSIFTSPPWCVRLCPGLNCPFSFSMTLMISSKGTESDRLSGKSRIYTAISNSLLCFWMLARWIFSCCSHIFTSRLSDRDVIPHQNYNILPLTFISKSGDSWLLEPKRLIVRMFATTNFLFLNDSNTCFEGLICV